MLSSLSFFPIFLPDGPFVVTTVPLSSFSTFSRFIAFFPFFPFWVFFCHFEW